VTAKQLPKKQHDAPEEKNFVQNKIFGQLIFPNQT